MTDHAGQLVTKNQLLDLVWPETFVSDAVLKVTIADLRKALADPTDKPVYIETLHRRGYRFIGVLEAAGCPFVEASNLAGRDDALRRLETLYSLAQSGSRQVAFVTGETGLGKTALIRTFLQSHPEARTAQGNCFEHQGAGEAYFPILEALTGLCSGPHREIAVGVLQRHAPTWLVQMPGIVPPDTAGLQRQVLGATPERMLREMAEGFEALTVSEPVILVLEDLQWGDRNTLDLLSCISRRTAASKLLIVVSYRSSEAPSSHPLRALKHELIARKAGEEIALKLLTAAQVADYLRMKHGSVAAGVAHLLYERTEGNPLFLVNLAEYARARDALNGPVAELATVVPDTLRQIVDHHIDRCDESARQVLEAAAILGVRFTAAAAAHLLGIEQTAVEEICDGLATAGSFLRADGSRELPGNRLTSAYSFIHAIYRDVLYRRSAESRRIRMHLRAGGYLQEVSPEQVSELAAHFESGRDYRAAIRFLWQQAQQDARRYSNQCAAETIHRALDLVELLPKEERAAMRQALVEQLGLICRSMGNMPAASAHFASLVAAARKAGDPDAEVKALLYQASALSWYDRDKCLTVVDEASRLAGRVTDPQLRAHTLGYCGYWNFLLREYRDADAEACRLAVEAAREPEDAQWLSLHVSRYAFFLAARSDYREALEYAEEGMDLSLAAGDAFDYMLCHFSAAWALLHLGEWNRMQRLLDSALMLAEENGHHLWSMLFQLQRAWLLQRAFAYDDSLEMCNRLLEESERTGHQPSKLVVLVLKAFSHLGLGELEKAGDCFEEFEQWAGRRRVLMDWMWRRQTHYGIALYWLARGDTARATMEAQRVCDAAAQPFERTLLALGKRLLASIALNEGRLDEAEDHIGRALALVQSGNAPLAEWQVFETAALIRRDEELLERSAESLWRLGERIGNDALRGSLFGSPKARSVLLNSKSALRAATR